MSNSVREVEQFETYTDVLEAFFAEPWSDGLPVVPPTVALVDEMIAAGALAPGEAIGTLPGRQLSLHVWQAAAAAVMAGCRADYFPVILATWQAMFDPRFNLHGVFSSTGGAAIAAIVSGPYSDIIGMNSGTGVFSPGNRANSTIGRAIRIGAMTSLQAIPGELDYGSFGHGGKYSFHFAESAPPKPWLAVREQLGYPGASTTVTVMPAEAPRQIMHRYSPSAQDLVKTIAAAMRDPSTNGVGSGTTFLVVLGPEHAGILAASGISQRQLSEALSEMSKTSVSELAAAGLRHDAAGAHYSPPDEAGRILTARPEHILITTAGGHGAGWSTVVPCWTWTRSTLPCTRPVRLPGELPSPPLSRAGFPDFA